MKSLLITIPHSGERIPDEAPWLKGLPETLLMYDVDRYVDRLYEPTINKFKIPSVKTEWHRYAIDLNRLEDDVDADSVEDHKNLTGKYPRGLHWSITTMGERLMPKPISKETHDLLIQKYFRPFHQQVKDTVAKMKQAGATEIYHVDAHSMPSVGTKEHRDPGETRADIVVSDCGGISCSTWFKDLVISAYEKAGFKIAYNWPYLGGRVTETYGRPKEGHHSIQVELKRGLYMDEKTKAFLPGPSAEVQLKLEAAVSSILKALK